MSERKDKIFQASTFKAGENSKGNLRVQFYLDKESAHDLAALLVQKSDEGAGTGIQLDIHETVGETKEGRTIKGGIMFCKEKQKQQQRQSKKSYAPKSNSQEDIVNKLRNKKVD